jgi:hypothetical protein
MLAFDIETFHLDPKVGGISVACVYDEANGISESFNFVANPGLDEEERFMKRLDEADILCAFCGARFDIPFIVERFKVPAERYSAWYRKLFDHFEICKWLFESSCGLDKLCARNGLPVKSSTGLQAIQWAKDGEWDKLIPYCMQDAIITYQISMKRSVILPLTAKSEIQCVRSDTCTDGWTFDVPELALTRT